MPWWTWLALGVLALALVATGIFAAYAIGKVERAQAIAEDLRKRVDELARTAEELERERARLAVSFERLSVLTWALSDARKSVTRLHRTYLRK